jgi:excisionase family DNA binding protein
MTVSQAAERLEISKSLCYRLIEERRLSCVRIGQRGRRGKILIREVDLAEFLRHCHNQARAD